MAESLEIETYLPRAKTPFRCFGRLGNCFCCLITSSGEPWVCIGPDWPFCLCLLSIILAVAVAFVVLMAPLAAPAIQVLGALIVTSAVGCYLITALKNPGIEMNLGVDLEDMDGKPPQKGRLKPCGKCGAVRKEGTYHCEDCNLCIREYDHHCPLTGKCIGEGNILFFYAFLISVFLFIVYLVIWIVSVTSQFRDSNI